MSKQQITLDRSGRVAIPQAIRTRLGLRPGAKLIIEEHDDQTVLLRPMPDQTILVDKDGVLVVRSRATGEVADAQAQAWQARMAELIRKTGL